jgi:hypothetical protein
MGIQENSKPQERGYEHFSTTKVLALAFLFVSYMVFSFSDIDVFWDLMRTWFYICRHLFIESLLTFRFEKKNAQRNYGNHHRIFIFLKHETQLCFLAASLSVTSNFLVVLFFRKANSLPLYLSYKKRKEFMYSRGNVIHLISNSDVFKGIRSISKLIDEIGNGGMELKKIEHKLSNKIIFFS